MEILIGIVVGALILALVVWGMLAEQKRRAALLALAQRLGLSYRSDRDRALAERFGFLNRLNQGAQRYGENLFSGRLDGHEVLAFDYHYETYSSDSKGRRQTHHHYLSVYALMLPRSFPELTICREGWLSKIAQAFGYDDIDFESAEFSRNFCVRAKDKRFAYDFCHPTCMEYLLGNADLDIEVEHNVLAMVFRGRLKLDLIEPNLRRLLHLRSLMPEYLFAIP